MDNGVTIRLARYDDIDQEGFSLLQETVFEPLVQKAGTVSFSPEFFNWKYNTPFGKAWIAIAEKNGKMVGSNSMIPLNLVVDGKVTRSWQSCDTAVLPAERGKGIFFKCISNLDTLIRDDEIFWGFPNRNSTRGLLKLGFKKTAHLKLWIRPLLFQKMKINVAAKGVTPELNLPEQHLLNGNYLEKSDEYLRWRYLQNPSYHYQILEMNSGQDRALVFLRELNLRERRLLMIMDHIGDNKIVIECFNKVKQFAKSRNIHFISYLGNALSQNQLFQLGFLPVPDFMLPKTQVLCTKTPGNNNLITKRWIVQTGDYDLF